MCMGLMRTKSLMRRKRNSPATLTSDYSDYENAPGCLATFGGFFCDFQATLAATMACNYDFQKMAFDYATLTRPWSPSSSLSVIPAPALLPIPAQIGVVCHGQPPPDPMGLCRHGSPHRPGRHKIPDVVQLAAPGKRPVHGLHRPCNSGIICSLFHGGTRNPTQADNIGR